MTDLVSSPIGGNSTVFVAGPPGTGKTTLAVQRLMHLLHQGIPPEQVLVLVPQRTLAAPYYQALSSPRVPTGRQVDVATLGGLARRTIDLFWPLIASQAGFADPKQWPRFLTLETTQYYMERVIGPFVAAGAFDGITIPRSRLVSQIIDDLNKAAAVGFAVEEISIRLKGAWSGESARLRIYDQVQTVATAFRQACLAGSLLDWSLQIELFRNRLLPLPQFRRYLLGGYRHLIVDNVEEDIPATHDLLRLWLPLCESALLIYDTDGGYRVFLGADPAGALALAQACREVVVLKQSYITSPEVAALGQALASPFRRSPVSSERAVHEPSPEQAQDTLLQALVLPPKPIRFHPQMLDWVAGEISHLVFEEAVQPGEVAVLAPFVSDALRFSLTERLERYGIATRTHRPSRQLHEEPAARCLLTLAKLAHPSWQRPPPAADVAQALAFSIAEMDPVRARLLADIVYRVKEGQPHLTAFYQIIPDTQERITYLLGGRYDELWGWLQDYVMRSGTSPTAEKLDFFLSRLFGEVLSQPGFGFHHNLEAGRVAASLIESVAKFRKALGVGWGGDVTVHEDLEYVDLVERGVIAAQYVSEWEIGRGNAILVVPAYTFLMRNQPVMVQFWLDAGSVAWFERIYQPLTHPYVLRRDWQEGKAWTDDDEVRVREEALGRLILGLSRRCRQRIYLAYSDLNERGYEQQGPLLMAVQRLLRRRVGTRQ